MSNLPEQPAWESGIHQLEESERAKAGPGGILNLQASQLANRTNWLRILVESAQDYREYTFYKSESDPDGTIAGLANTPAGKMFRVAQGLNDDLAFIYYLNDSGTALPLTALLGRGAITNNVREYSTLTSAENDVLAGNILDGSTCWISDPTNETLKVEYINNGGTLSATGRKIASQQAVDEVAETVNAVAEIVKSSDDSETLVDFCDEDGVIGAKVIMNQKGIGFSSHAVGLMPELIQNLLFSFFKSDGEGLSFEDEDGHILADARNGVVRALGITLKYDWVTQIVSMFGSDLGLESDSVRFFVDNSSDDIITMMDPDGVIFLRLTKDFQLLTRINMGGSVSGQDTIARMSNRALSRITATSRQRGYLTQMPTADINVFLNVGQSHSVGTFSRVALSVGQALGNLMLGHSPRGTNYVNTTTSEVYGPVGGNILVELVEVRQLDDGTLSASSGSFGETSLSGWLNMAKTLHNQHLMTENDTSRVFAGACPGVGGKTLAQLSKGASPNLYNHIITALQGIKEAADMAGKTSCFCGVTFMQMENDGSTPYATYYPQLEQFYSDVNADGMAVFGQTRAPHWYFYQGGGMYTSDTNSMAASRALLDFCDNHPGLASFVNPVGQLPNPVNPDGNDNHLFANSYRWFGCDVGRVTDLVHRGVSRPVFRMREAVYSGSVATVSLSPPVPPFKFVPAYIGSVATMHADKGFTIRDGAGHLHGADLTVEAVSDTVVSITASRALVSPVQIWLGDKTYHSGTHNIADSEDTTATYSWDIVTGAPAEESIAELNGKPYALRNWCGADIITATEEV
ncbi:flagellar biosynthesis, cell-distal portion of basal-body rod [Klebsiella pneumoniae]|uniref:Flagellar biosynthesis, cell-distal portion of basal-body rod n=1 Tax=Klebsiella pneumoniae TaxID=573 RepID=A0A378H4L2_KLEPN|nr:flagellar biosynthesis, cell-distal portion of basal-body rod [Klebsiella pneumoniae]